MTIEESKNKSAKNSSERRPHKGKSLLEFPDNYVCIDLETTGLYPQEDEIIQVAAIKVCQGKIIDTFCSLVKPEYMERVTSFITSLTGITKEMLSSAPQPEEVLPILFKFIGDQIIIGHNVNFDINFLYDYAQYYEIGTLANDFVDTMRLARRLFPHFENHKLQTLATEFKISYSGAHQANIDAKITVGCYEYMHRYIKENDCTEKLRPRMRKKNAFGHCYLKATDIVSSLTDFDEDNPFFKQVVVFTGRLEKMSRQFAMQIVADLGGINSDSVTKKTNFLILGNNDYCSTIKGGKSGKQKKAEELILKGVDLKILPESVFYDMLEIEL